MNYKKTADGCAVVQVTILTTKPWPFTYAINNELLQT